MDRPILVTGAHRTGTTWVGRILAAHPKMAYISEPLNVLHHPGLLADPVVHWYTYICRSNESGLVSSFTDLLNFRYHLWPAVGSLRSGRDFLRLLRDLGIFLRGRVLRQRPLLKDPFAAFSIPWFTERLDMQVVVTIRHPAGFAGSLKRLDWPFDFRDLLAQPLLMQDRLEPFRREMQAIRAQDVIGQAALLWTVIYRTVLTDCARRPDIQIVRHEDLSLDPPAGFRRLYEALGLEFTPQVEQVIIKTSSPANPKEGSPVKAHTIKLDSRANLEVWKKHLSPEEIDRVRRVTGEVAQGFYPEESWR